MRGHRGLDHEVKASLQAAVVLANSAGPPDTLRSVAELNAFCKRFGYSCLHGRGHTELKEVRASRPVLRALLTAQPDTASEMVNKLLADARAVPRLVRHDRFDWHLHASVAGASLATQLTVATAMAMIDVIRANEMSRLGACTDCGSLLVDVSRNRSRRFCSAACGNRNAVAAYRARKR